MAGDVSPTAQGPTSKFIREVSQPVRRGHRAEPDHGVQCSPHNNPTIETGIESDGNPGLAPRLPYR